jgi:hypothetical protein
MRVEEKEVRVGSNGTRGMQVIHFMKLIIKIDFIALR